MNKPNTLKPIKHIAGEILLYFYVIQRNDPVKLSNWITSFEIMHLPEERKHEGIINNDKSDIFSNLLKIAGSTVNIYNALNYLENKYFLTFRNQKTNTSDHFHGIQLTSSGVDIIEDIERGEEEKREFQVNFNIKVENNFNVESLIKAEIGSLFKASLI